MRNSERAHGDLLTFVAVAALAFVGLVIPAAADASFLDDSFGSEGTVDLGAAPNDVVVDHTGRILVALDGGGSIVVAAYDDTGVPDPSFGDDGVATVDLPDDATAVALTVDPANRIVVGASHARFQGVIVRLTSDGELDPAYDGDGIDFTNADVDDVLAQPDSRIVVLGITSVSLGDGARYSFRFARYTATGSRDSSFSEDGILEASSGGPSSAGLGGGELARGPDGSLVALAHETPCCQPNDRAVLTKVTSGGTVVDSFGTGGTPGVARHGYHGSSPSGLAVQPDGKILFAGSTPQYEYPTAPRRVAQAVRLLSDGTADTGWGPDGAARAEFFGPDGGSATTDLTLMPNGRVVLSAYAAPVGGELQLAAARFLPNGSLDSTFGLDGMAWTSYPSDRRVESALAVDALGRPILAAWTYHPDTGAPVQPLLIRFLASGGFPDGNGGGGGGGPECGNEGQPSCCDAENPCFGDGDGDGGVAGGVAGRVGLQVHRVVVPKTIGGLIRRGVRVLASCDVKCKLSVKVKISQALRDRLGLSKTLIARGSAGAAANKRRWVSARLTGAAARAFNAHGGGGRLQVKVRAEGPETQSATVAVAG